MKKNEKRRPKREGEGWRKMCTRSARSNYLTIAISNCEKLKYEKLATCPHMLEPNTYECPIRMNLTYWAEILIFDQKMSYSAQYVRMAMTLKILQVLIILPSDNL